MPFKNVKHIMLYHAIAQDYRPKNDESAKYEEYTLYNSSNDGDRETLQIVPVVAEAIE